MQSMLSSSSIRLLSSAVSRRIIITHQCSSRRSGVLPVPALARRHLSSTTSNNSPAKTTTEFQKLPPDVQRELLRHVKPTAAARAHAAAAAAATANATKLPPAAIKGATSTTTYYWLLGCVLFVSAAGSLPYLATQTIGSLTDRDEKLSPSGVRRGAFANSGTHDAGRDPNWDWKNGKYVYPKGFAEHLKMQDPNQTDFGPDMGRIVADEKKQNADTAAAAASQNQ